MAGADRQAAEAVQGSKALSPCRFQENDQAVDESLDLDGDFAEQQKMMSKRRRAAKDKPEYRLKKALPFAKPFVPTIRPLTVADLEACIALENAAFTQPEHRASPEKASPRHRNVSPPPSYHPSSTDLAYRLTVCPEVSLGLFVTIAPEQAKDLGIETLALARPVETGRADGAVSVLLAHAISTRTHGDVVTDADMDYPKDWRARSARVAEPVGHQEGGKTVALHSFAVLPRVHRCGLGQMLMRAFLDQMKSCGLVQRVALICQEHLATYYQRSGYKCLGKSEAQFGGGGWYNMAIDLQSSAGSQQPEDSQEPGEPLPKKVKPVA
ncbi:b9caec81-fd07-40dd-a873-22daab84fcf0 [Thermothielavioides terrestris]|uniref:B9caec81-fd07-40dd-a873-22daab84fcf0 n=1 Tax=Thermothielavioides terrestris TaxID=2587410 RepID=A0A3S4B7C3_9PEZI|nr:b9caec81-fd07-40dd-a873-22daab84fcf0 [Thermothielavioides terrestris]